MILRILATTFVLILAASSASAGIINSQDSILDEVTISSGGFDSPDSPDEDRPMVREGQSNGMSASMVSAVKSSNSQALQDFYQLFLPSFKPRIFAEFENAQLPPSPILDGLLKPS